MLELRLPEDGVGFVEGGICRYVTSGFEVCRVRGYGLVGTMYDILYYYMLTMPHTHRF